METLWTLKRWYYWTSINSKSRIYSLNKYLLITYNFFFLFLFCFLFYQANHLVMALKLLPACVIMMRSLQRMKSHLKQEDKADMKADTVYRKMWRRKTGLLFVNVSYTKRPANLSLSGLSMCSVIGSNMEICCLWTPSRSLCVCEHKNHDSNRL